MQEPRQRVSEHASTPPNRALLALSSAQLPCGSTPKDCGQRSQGKIGAQVRLEIMQNDLTPEVEVEREFVGFTDKTRQHVELNLRWTSK